eukprot:6699982-Pyramimonas_sp.AAC.1
MEGRRKKREDEMLPFWGPPGWPSWPWLDAARLRNRKGPLVVSSDQFCSGAMALDCGLLRRLPLKFLLESSAHPF